MRKKVGIKLEDVRHAVYITFYVFQISIHSILAKTLYEEKI
jgi:hypothetical protein